MRMRVQVLLVQALVLGLLVVLAQVAVTEGWVNRFLLPSPGDIWDAGVGIATGEHPLAAFLSTIGATLSAILLAVAVGVPAGWALWRYPVLGRAYEGWLGAIFASPKLLLYPLFLVVMGRGFGTLLAMAWITAVIPIVLKTREGLASVPAVLVRVGRSFNLGERQLLWKVMFPAAVPAIFTGIRLSMIYTLIVVVALEFLLSLGGLGGMVGDMYDRYDIPATYAAIVFVLVLSAVYFRILERIQTWLRSD